jgi:hypothetical protein
MIFDEVSQQGLDLRLRFRLDGELSCSLLAIGEYPFVKILEEGRMRVYGKGRERKEAGKVAEGQSQLVPLAQSGRV